MLQELIELEARFQPYLKPGDYTFIGPVDQQLWQPFFKKANELATVVSVFQSMHDVMSDKDATRQALLFLPADTPLRIFVVTQMEDDSFLGYSTIESYCRVNNIDFQP